MGFWGHAWLAHLVCVDGPCVLTRTSLITFKVQQSDGSWKNRVWLLGYVESEGARTFLCSSQRMVTVKPGAVRLLSLPSFFPTPTLCTCLKFTYTQGSVLRIPGSASTWSSLEALSCRCRWPWTDSRPGRVGGRAGVLCFSPVCCNQLHFAWVHRQSHVAV